MFVRTVTFQRANNYGAAMQTYALAKYLTDTGNKVEILNYCPDWMRQIDSPFYGFLCKPSWENFKLLSSRIIKRQKFEEFLTKFSQVGELFKNKVELAKLPDCDIYVAGSDQIWNPEITNGLDDIYLLDFPTAAVKIAYAASCGLDELPDGLVQSVTKKISSFKGVFVREHYLEKRLKDWGANNAVGVLDPTFLLDRESYRDIEIVPKYSKYLLIYTMFQSKKLRQLAKKVADYYGLQIVEVSAQKEWPADYVEPFAGPREWLGLIDKADFVITNSFHGAALSINYRKNLYVMKAENRSSRIYSMLDDFDMNDRFVRDEDVEKLEITCTNYGKYERNIVRRIEESKAFLKGYFNAENR